MRGAPPAPRAFCTPTARAEGDSARRRAGAPGGSQSSGRREGEGVALSEEAQWKQRGGSRGRLRAGLGQLRRVDVDESVASAEQGGRFTVASREARRGRLCLCRGC